LSSWDAGRRRRERKSIVVVGDVGGMMVYMIL
jgi:hypothetical protein